MDDFHAGKFWFVEEGPWDGYGNGTYRPNIVGADTTPCWASPVFIRKVADQIVDWWNEHDDGYFAWYEESEDAYVFGHDYSDDIEVYHGRYEVVTDTFLARVYAIGTPTEVGRGGWCWTESGVQSPADKSDAVYQENRAAAKKALSQFLDEIA